MLLKSTNTQVGAFLFSPFLFSATPTFPPLLVVCNILFDIELLMILIVNKIDHNLIFYHRLLNITVGIAEHIFYVSA